MDTLLGADGPRSPLPAEFSRPVVSQPTMLDRLPDARYKLNEFEYLLRLLSAELKRAGEPLPIRTFIAAALGAYRAVFFRIEQNIRGNAELRAWYENALQARGFPWQEPGPKCATCGQRSNAVWHDGHAVLTTLKHSRDADVHHEDVRLEGTVTLFLGWVGAEDEQDPIVVNRSVFIGTERSGHIEAAPSLVYAYDVLQALVDAYELKLREYVATSAARKVERRKGRARKRLLAKGTLTS